MSDHEQTSSSSGETPNPAGYLPEGTVVDDRYEVGDLIGEGGYGVVYRAIQRTTGQFVALKVMRMDRLTEEDVRVYEIGRFEREMKLIGQLNHANVVRLIDFGTLPTGQLYSVIEYIDGVTLSHLLRTEGALHPREATTLMTQVLEALGAAHELGIVYRDLKPQNIMVLTHSSRRSIKLLDFGISGILEDVRDQDYEHLTQDGKINGTPSYMSPEQLRSLPLTPQTDIYAWGLVFLEVLLGYRIVQADSYVEILAQQISHKPIEIPEELAVQPLGAILAKAVAKSMEERYATVSELLLDLEDCFIPKAMTLSSTGVIARQRIEETLALRQSQQLPALSQNSSSWVTQSGELPLGLGQEDSSIQEEVPPSSNRPLVLVLLLITIVVILGVIILAIQPPKEVDLSDPVAKTTPKEDTTTVVQPTPPVELKKLPVPSPTPHKPMIRYSSDITPATALVKLDGKLVGKGYIDLEVPHDGKKRTLTVQAEGHELYTLTLVNKPPPKEIALVPMPKVKNKRRTKTLKPPATMTTSTKKSSTTKPAQNTATKPEPSTSTSTWKLKTNDLEDPWAK